MKAEEINGNIVITADEGKAFVRVSDGLNFGDQITLGYNYHVTPPRLEVPGDFVEVDENPLNIDTEN